MEYLSCWWVNLPEVLNIWNVGVKLGLLDIVKVTELSYVIVNNYLV